MQSLRLQWRTLIFAVLLGLLPARVVLAGNEPALTKEQIQQFLLTAKVIKSAPAHKGITNSLRLTLTDGTITHDAHFQPIDEHAAVKEVAFGRKEINFVDSYKYNIAAYQLAAMLGLDDVVPVYVERKWNGQKGSFGWWLPVKMDEADRIKKKISPPDSDTWNKQMYRIRVLDQMVYDTDANLTNVQIGEDWKVYRIDFTRAFRGFKALQTESDLVRCDRQLLTKLKVLNGDELAARTKGFLTKEEVKAVMARRDKIVAHFQKLISEKGEAEILY
ncbi:MAG TPA: hypothetical protein VJ756_03860 [Terriglobales bacterium]|nr:hypothetical protein [Terriglobales bacterium]